MKRIMTMVLLVVMVLTSYPSETISAKEKCDWETIYDKYLQSNFDDGKEYKAALIYVDGDEIPELYLNSSDDVWLGNEECWLLSISKNKVKKSSIPNYKIKYAPKKNRIYYHQGAGSFILDASRMEKLEKGKIKTIWTSMKDVDPTQAGQPTEYYINDKVVSKKYYQQYISKQTSKYKWKSIGKQLKLLSKIKAQLSK